MAIEYRDNCGLLEVEELVCREFYEYYKENRTKVAQGINDFNLFKKAIGGLLTTINKLAVKTEGGLYLQGIGYFAHVLSTYETASALYSKSFFKRLERDKFYFMWFFPDKRFKGWFLERRGTKLNQKKLDNYNIHFEAIKAYYESKAYSAKVESTHNKRYKYC